MSEEQMRERCAVLVERCADEFHAGDTEAVAAAVRALEPKSGSVATVRQSQWDKHGQQAAEQMRERCAVRFEEMAKALVERGHRYLSKEIAAAIRAAE